MNLEMFRGDTKTINLTVSSNGVAVNLTGATVRLTVKTSVTDEDVAAVLQKTVTTHTVPLDGETSIVIAPADTNAVTPAVYVYDVQLKQSSGAISTLLFGEFRINADVTRTTT